MSRRQGLLKAFIFGSFFMQNGQRGRSLARLCFFTYFISYLTRINYGAVITEIVNAEGFSKSAVSVAVTVSFITYGAGQLINGYLGDRIRPEKLIFSGLLLTSAMNLLVPVLVRPEEVRILWGINGFAQALMWPPMVKLLSGNLPQDEYRTACVRVGWGSSLATVAIYLTAPLFIRLSGWKSLFVFCGAAALLYAFFWMKGIRKTLKDGSGPVKTVSGLSEKEKPADSSRTGLKTSELVLLLLILPAIVMQGILRDGVTTWMPTYISETYHLKSTSSILTGALMPLFGMLCMEASAATNRKLIPNEMVCSLVWFLPALLGSVILLFLPASSPALSVLMSVLITGSMHGVNIILTGMLSPYFQKAGKVSFVSGLLNACTYVGSALSTFGFAKIAEVKGWNAVMPVWAAAAFAGVLFCLLVSGKWERFRKG